MKTEEMPPMEVPRPIRRYSITTMYLCVMVTLIVLLELIEVFR